MLDQLMSVGNLSERNDLGDVQPLPPRLKSLVNVASCFDLGLGRYLFLPCVWPSSAWWQYFVIHSLIKEEKEAN